ncbi:MAG: DNA polymerase I [Patescibacteria group bacterium]|nr:DNA polymerase I [Patescibacteria group bacterium]
MAKDKKKLVLIDGNALVHRAFHALFRANLTSPKGEPTGAIYGFAVMLLNILQKLDPDYIAVAFDTKKPTFRHEEFEDYKATRVAAPQELYDQIPKVQFLAATFNIPVFLKDGFEADDIIGTLAHQAGGKVDTYIATGDMDALQLVDESTFVYAPRKGFSDIVTYDIAEVEKKMKGLTPGQVIDFKGLRGDPSDNIPGIPGVGEVTATKLLLEYGSIDGIYENIDKLPEKQQTLLTKHKAKALQSRSLATILTDIPIKLDLKKAEAVEFDANEVKELFTKLGFKSLINRVPNGTLTREAQTSFFNSKQSEKAVPAKRLSSIEKLDQELNPILRHMEANGILLDVKFINKLNDQVVNELKKLTRAIYKQAEKEFNINSPLQLSEVLFEDLGLPTIGIKRNKTGYSTAVGELEKIIDHHKIIRNILKYRELEKLRNTYLETLPKLVDKDNRIHTTYAQETSTGRLSSSNPNLQNIPIRSELGAEVRKAFIAPPNYILLAADYSQIELRIVASLAKDQRMMDSFNKGEDIHARVAAEINGITIKEITKNQRRNAKTVNFGLIYGVSPYGLSAQTDMTVGEASQYIEKYFALHPGIKKYMKDIVAFAQQNGYVETLFGRKREMPELSSSIPAVRNAAHRAAINMPIQGTAADMMKAAMIEVYKQLPKISKDSRMLLQIHDEIVLEVPKADVKKVAKLVKTAMENIYKLDVPIVVNVSTGKSWGTTKEIKDA